MSGHIGEPSDETPETPAQASPNLRPPVNASPGAASHESSASPPDGEIGMSNTAASNTGWAHYARVLREYAKSHPVGALVWRVVVALVGAALLVAGGVMLVLPGPGWAAIALGLVVLASEFVWFEKPLGPVKRLLARAGEKVGSPRRRRLLIIAMVVLTIGSALFYELYLHPRGLLPWSR